MASENDIPTFFHDLDSRFKDAAKLDESSATRFNVFRYIAPDELKLSSLIRDLFDPRGPHGQGDLFLRCFLKAVKLGHLSIDDDCRAKCEETTTWSVRNSQRSIDIVVSPNSHYGIGIENKPWAEDQPGWVFDYSDHLSRKYGDENFLLVFLARQGREPTAQEDKQKCKELEQKGKFIIICYEREFSRWLEECIANCAAEKVRSFLRDFIKYVPTMGGGDMDSGDEVKLVASYIGENPARLRVAYATRQAWLQVRERIAAEFLDELWRALHAELGDGWEVTNPRAAVFSGYDFHIAKRGWENRHFIALYPEHGEGRGFSMGVMKKGKGVPHIERLESLRMGLAETYHGQANPDWWEWCGYVKPEYENWDNPEALEKLQEKGEAIEYFKQYFLRIKDRCEGVIDGTYGNSGAT